MTEIVQIRIGKHMTGIIGLKDVLAETAKQSTGMTDHDISRLLVQKLSKKNYIPSGVTDIYGAALLREYKKHLGQAVEALPVEGIQIKVLGAGCPSCDRLEQEMMAVIEETGIEADLEHVRDLKEISRYGIMGSPALVINDEVKFAGKVPSRNKLKDLIKQAGNKISS